jgi:hypothetical protein
MAEEASTKFAGAILDEIYKDLKLQFEQRRDMVLEADAPGKGYVPPKALHIDGVEDIIKVANDGMSNAAKNNEVLEVTAVSRQGNVLMGLARDNYSATAGRLEQCRNYALYLKRALNEAKDPNDPTESDGMLLANIRKVEQ